MGLISRQSSCTTTFGSRPNPRIWTPPSSRKVASVKGFLSLTRNEGHVLRCVDAVRPRREHGSRLRAAHRRRRPKGLDARGAPWPFAAFLTHAAPDQTADVS